jgi:S-adenosylmethionine:tRNA ribosyltransferase-isomerase
MGLKTEEFDYPLPKEFVAQYPQTDRASSRLLVLHRQDGNLEHRSFKDIVEYLRDGDVLVVNDTKVLPARLKGRKPTGGLVDILLVEKIDQHTWTCLVDGAKRGSNAVDVTIGDVPVRLERDDRFWHIDFLEAPADEVMARHGTMPLPHYIKRGENGKGSLDTEGYQTVYAQKLGSIAAPTAGLHFTDDLLDRIRLMGVTVLKITLHIGVGTFFLVKTEQVEDHRMHREYYTVEPDTIALLRDAKTRGGRVFAVGTSATRTLETLFSQNGNAMHQGYTELFIHPGYAFKVVDNLITNFHLPRSTPLLLVCAFAGRENIFEAYRQAMALNYRFYSYGDAMLVL